VSLLSCPCYHLLIAMSALRNTRCEPPSVAPPGVPFLPAFGLERLQAHILKLYSHLLSMRFGMFNHLPVLCCFTNAFHSLAICLSKEWIPDQSCCSIFSGLCWLSSSEAASCNNQAALSQRLSFFILILPSIFLILMGNCWLCAHGKRTVALVTVHWSGNVHVSCPC
jgi:hypothetical protein